jgi:CheY-like chemotaxis protein
LRKKRGHRRRAISRACGTRIAMKGRQMTARYPVAPAIPRPWRVLLVQRDRWLRSCAGAALAARGCDVVEAGSLAAARHELAAASFDAVVTAISLGDGDGFAVVHAARRAGRTAPVLVARSFASSSADRGIWFSSSPVPTPLFEAIYGASTDSTHRAERRSAEITWPVPVPSQVATRRLPVLGV